MKERIERLRGILDQLDNIKACTDRTIERLDKLVNSEYMKEYEVDRPYSIYFNNVRKTKDKELEILLKNRLKPRVRIEYFDDTVRVFRTDIEMELRRLEIILTS